MCVLTLSNTRACLVVAKDQEKGKGTTRIKAILWASGDRVNCAALPVSLHTCVCGRREKGYCDEDLYKREQRTVQTFVEVSFLAPSTNTRM